MSLAAVGTMTWHTASALPAKSAPSSHVRPTTEYARYSTSTTACACRDSPIVTTPREREEKKRSAGARGCISSSAPGRKKKRGRGRIGRAPSRLHPARRKIHYTARAPSPQVQRQMRQMRILLARPPTDSSVRTHRARALRDHRIASWTSQSIETRLDRTAPSTHHDHDREIRRCVHPRLCRIASPALRAICRRHLLR
ncbi:hypothetical protein B0H16DRAFT_907173 [Mycena metata]|uniref:Uncharacterized protein n=1 Tax=Mycena metata TaxID=1033252 RepID=A0AAD7IR03_9AGAR|nr:hypothetical protein B0H16DRAFT_907173 [Mycena metata]